MSELRSAIESLRAEVLLELPDARAEEDFSELWRSQELAQLELLRRLADLERRRVFERDGHLSVAAWLVSRFRVGWGAARDQVRVARALEEMPQTRRALDAGDVSMSGVRLLVDARDAGPELFSRAERQLVEAARIHSVADLRRVAAFWRAQVEAEQLDAEARSRGEEDDDRTPAQRRVDALGVIMRYSLDRSDRPTVAGERPHVTVTVAAEGLRGDRQAPAELDHTGPVGAEVARRLACDASITRVVMSGRSEPLDVGRKTSVISSAMRRAVIVRDRHCRFPGCDRPQTWCDAHHVQHWADGGPTAMANLLLLCRRHHRMVHQRGGFRLELLDGRPVFRRADGSLLKERPPP